MAAIAFGVAGSMVLALNSCSTTPATLAAPPVIPGATFVGNKARAECHKTITLAGVAKTAPAAGLVMTTVGSSATAATFTTPVMPNNAPWFTQ